MQIRHVSQQSLSPIDCWIVYMKDKNSQLPTELRTGSRLFMKCKSLFIVKWGYTDLLTVGHIMRICQIGERQVCGAALLKENLEELGLSTSIIARE